MLPEFSKARRKMNELWNRAFFLALYGGEPLLTQMPLRVQKEGDRAFIGNSEMDYKQCSVKSSFKFKNAQGMSLDEFFGAPLNLGAEMAAQQARTVYDKLRTPSPHWTHFEWKPGELKFEQLLNIWEQMELDFGSDGKPKWPELHIPPVALEEVQTKLRQWHENSEYRKKIEHLIERKRKEFNERETHRRLVD
jgi:hypothetical protein